MNNEYLTRILKGDASLPVSETFRWRRDAEGSREDWLANGFMVSEIEYDDKALAWKFMFI